MQAISVAGIATNNDSELFNKLLQTLRKVSTNMMDLQLVTYFALTDGESNVEKELLFYERPRQSNKDIGKFLDDACQLVRQQVNVSRLLDLWAVKLSTMEAETLPPSGGLDTDTVEAGTTLLEEFVNNLWDHGNLTRLCTFFNSP